MLRIKLAVTGSFVALAAFGLQLPAQSQTIALSWTSGGGSGTSSLTRGWAFSTASAITVTHLGFWDDGLDGLGSSHAIKIWDSTGVEYVSGTVSAGTTDPLDGAFRYSSALTGTTTLGAGSYVIGGMQAGDAGWRYVPAGNLVMASGLTYLGSRSGNSSFSFPGNVTSSFDAGYFGPNFKFTAGGGAVPEPGEWAAMGILGAGLTGLVLRKRRTA